MPVVWRKVVGGGLKGQELSRRFHCSCIGDKVFNTIQLNSAKGLKTSTQIMTTMFIVYLLEITANALLDGIADYTDLLSSHRTDVPHNQVWFTSSQYA